MDLSKGGPKYVCVQTVIWGLRNNKQRMIREYNEERPHVSIGDLKPREYLDLENSKSA
jgi:transposase InsO family protein